MLGWRVETRAGATVPRLVAVLRTPPAAGCTVAQPTEGAGAPPSKVVQAGNGSTTIAVRQPTTLRQSELSKEGIRMTAPAFKALYTHGLRESQLVNGSLQPSVMVSRPVTIPTAVFAEPHVPVLPTGSTLACSQLVHAIISVCCLDLSWTDQVQGMCRIMLMHVLRSYRYLHADQVGRAAARSGCAHRAQKQRRRLRPLRASPRGNQELAGWQADHSLDTERSQRQWGTAYP